MLQRVDYKLEFERKRNIKLITPCCGKLNKDGKFVNFKGFPEAFGYCHSCGVSTVPPSLYKDDEGNEYIWNETTNNFEKHVTQLSYDSVTQSSNTLIQSCVTSEEFPSKNIKYIDYDVVRLFVENPKENNLLFYLRNTYPEDLVNSVKEMYHIGTGKDGGVVFWLINIEGNVQKAKVVYYGKDGKRTNYFKVPYKNENGYYSCLFGEHLLAFDNHKPIVLVESEKTAIVCAMELPNYRWLAYGGINGLTDTKLKPLIGEKVVIVPDMSEKAVAIMQKKLHDLKQLGIDAEIWDMTQGMSDEQLKEQGWYNCDLEDVFRGYKGLN
ncbi:DUF6371 domain-containing protein [Aestuariibaculum suncheonense]|uniref:DUF6371 domain-containing protein n=1 Tax=Aestuariibaculum suncheonense TaxID=1028745 RepID=A0A8J6QAB7_9FLAO|nr:DUF6371 domain-containing protein [Aestuariibaculum suncheonense]MBD0836531.1 hypothetical protein [Aestuariibaculum suncheonense]